MDSVVCSTLRLEVLDKWCETSDVHYIRKVLSGGEEFLRLFHDFGSMKGLPGQKSELTRKQVKDLERFGVI